MHKIAHVYSYGKCPESPSTYIIHVLTKRSLKKNILIQNLIKIFINSRRQLERERAREN